MRIGTPKQQQEQLKAERERRAIEKWQAADKALPQPGQAIFLEASGIFAFYYDDLKRDSIDAMDDIATLRPYLCERRRPAAPKLADLIQNDIEQEWCNSDGNFTLELPDVSDLQAELDRRFSWARDEDIGLWFATDVALDHRDIQEAIEAHRREIDADDQH